MRTYKIDEICAVCNLDQEIILHFVSEDWVLPHDTEFLGFDDEDLARIRLIKDLKFEMGVNDEAVPVILHLIDKLNLVLKR